MSYLNNTIQLIRYIMVKSLKCSHQVTFTKSTVVLTLGYVHKHAYTNMYSIMYTIMSYSVEAHVLQSEQDRSVYGVYQTYTLHTNIQNIPH